MDPAPEDAPAGTELVQLDRDHPGFRDALYRSRRNAIAKLALEHRAGEPAPRIDYTAVEGDVWRIALENLSPLHMRYACREFLEHWPSLEFRPEEIPQFDEVNARLLPRTGFRLSPVAGLVSPRAFMSHLGRGLFLATQYMRHHSTPLYTPEPDVIHELVGHAALLAHPRFAHVNRLFGAATDAADEATVEKLIRTYWYTLEFGAVREGDALKVVGAGLLSSFGELGRFEREAELRPFSLAAIGATGFDPTDYQRVVFVADSTDALLGTLERWLEDIARTGRAAE